MQAIKAAPTGRVFERGQPVAFCDQFVFLFQCQVKHETGQNRWQTAASGSRRTAFPIGGRREYYNVVGSARDDSSAYLLLA